MTTVTLTLEDEAAQCVRDAAVLARDRYACILASQPSMPDEELQVQVAHLTAAEHLISEALQGHLVPSPSSTGGSHHRTSAAPDEGMGGSTGSAAGAPATTFAPTVHDQHHEPSSGLTNGLLVPSAPDHAAEGGGATSLTPELVEAAGSPAIAALMRQQGAA